MVKYKFDGIATVSATLIFSAMASSPLAFLTTGWLGKITFFLLKKFTNWGANKGLAILNVGVDLLSTHFEQKDYDEAMEQADKAVKQILKTKKKLNSKEMEDIDGPVIEAYRRFARFV